MEQQLPSLSAGLLTWIDDSLYLLLERPAGFATCGEALWGMALELMRFRMLITGREMTYEVFGQMMRHAQILPPTGPAITFPDESDDVFAEKIRQVAIHFAGYDPGDRPARDTAWKDHFHGCKECRTGIRHRQEGCEEGMKLQCQLPGSRSCVDNMDRTLWRLASEAETAHAILTDLGIPTHDEAGNERGLVDRIGLSRTNWDS